MYFDVFFLFTQPPAPVEVTFEEKEKLELEKFKKRKILLKQNLRNMMVLNSCIHSSFL